MKLKRREFLKSIVPALLGGKKVLEDLVSGERDDPEPEKVVQEEEPIHFWEGEMYLPMVFGGQGYALPPIAPWEREDLYIESSGIVYGPIQIQQDGMLIMEGIRDGIVATLADQQEGRT